MDNNAIYKHTQIAYVLIISLILCILLTTYIGPIKLENSIIFIADIILLFCILLFYKLTVIVDDSFVKLVFGIGLIRIKFKVSNIESVKTVKNHLLNGWGIHLIKKGWLFNVSGLYAVELTMKNEKKYRIGSDEPNVLSDFIKNKINA